MEENIFFYIILILYFILYIMKTLYISRSSGVGVNYFPRTLSVIFFVSRAHNKENVISPVVIREIRITCRLVVCVRITLQLC